MAAKNRRGLESDEYDIPQARYLYAKGEQGPGRGLLADFTDDLGLYVKKTLSPELLGAMTAPRDSQVYELSRFAVDKDFSTLAGGVSNVTMKMFQSLYHHVQQQRITRYVTVTSVGVEKHSALRDPCEG
ncbi:acyl-homoserine-lactone synthase [Vibrio metschnikovii]